MFLNYFVVIVHLATEDGAEYHLNVLDKAVMMKIVAVYADFVGIYHLVVVLLCDYLCRSVVSLGLFLCNIVRNHLIFKAILQCGGSCDTGTEFQHFAVGAFELIGISRYVRTRANKRHIADKNIPKPGQLIELIGV